MNKLIKQAFTLIELLVVIAIIGILSGLIVVSMSDVTQKANIAKAQVFSNSLRNALMANLVAIWKFDDITDYNTSTMIIGSTSGNVPDSWGTNNGTAANGPLIKTSECVFGKCVYFNGTNNYITVPGGSGSVLNMDYITIEAWIYLSSTPSDVVTIVSKGGQGSNSHIWFYYYPSSARLGLEYGNGTTRTVAYYSITPKLNTWYHLVGTYDGTTGYAYVNGLRGNAQTSITGVLGKNTDWLVIGRYSTNGSYYWPGMLDEIRIYDKAISASQIKDHYYAGLNNLLINGSINREEYLSRLNDYASNN